MTIQSSEHVFERLYEAYYDEVHAFCMRRVGRAASDDATSETFLVAWRRLDDVEIRFERAWLFGIARNVVRNTWRSSMRATRTVDRVRGVREDGPRPPEELVVERAASDAVRCLWQLGDRDQEILMLSAWDGLSGDEISQVLGVSVNAVHQRLHRAKKRLAKQLAKAQRAASQVAEEGAL